MNWLTKGEDKLDNLPTRDKFREPDDGRDHYRGQDYPYRRVGQWLEAQVGQHHDTVFSKFVKLEWLPKQYRNREKFKAHVEVDTFIEDGKICFYDRNSYNYGEGKPYRFLNEESGVTLYIHPKSHCLCIYKNNRRFNYAQDYRFRLSRRFRAIGDYHQYYKQNGIWYEIKAEPITDPNFVPWPSRDFRKGPRDVLLEPDNSWDRRVKTNPYVKITLKRQLSREELFRNCLFNDPPTEEEKYKKCPKCGGFGNYCIHFVTERLDSSTYYRLPRKSAIAI